MKKLLMVLLLGLSFTTISPAYAMDPRTVAMYQMSHGTNATAFAQARTEQQIYANMRNNAYMQGKIDGLNARMKFLETTSCLTAMVLIATVAYLAGFVARQEKRTPWIVKMSTRLFKKLRPRTKPPESPGHLDHPEENPGMVPTT
ncbi:MAG: hypothetical protein P4L61_02240 [Candidatus Pacebacteria bacterium]|nr:hypothetical protein [Candidatus Paceibacterota bacterium]